MQCMVMFLHYMKINTDDSFVVQGECIPTAGGGTAVLFNDVECLTHESPASKC